MVKNRPPLRNEHGIAIVACLLALTLLLALGAALVLSSSADTMIAGNFRRSLEGEDAAGAGLELAIGNLVGVPDWDLVLTGSAQSGFVDGPPGGVRTLHDGTVLNLTQIVNTANCSSITACTDGQMDAVTIDRPWGSNNPRWQLYAYGPLRDMLPTGSIHSDSYIVVLVADDQGESDGNPLADGAIEGDPGTGVIVIRSESFGPSNTHRGVEASVVRRSGVLHILSWRSLSRLEYP